MKKHPLSVKHGTPFPFNDRTLAEVCAMEIRKLTRAATIRKLTYAERNRAD